MVFETKNNYIVGKEYKISSADQGIIVNNNDTNCLIKVLFTHYESICDGDILWVDKNYAQTYVVAGEKYIVVDISHVIAKVQE